MPTRAAISEGKGLMQNHLMHEAFGPLLLSSISNLNNTLKANQTTVSVSKN